jgi:hypothetical protein
VTCDNAGNILKAFQIFDSDKDGDLGSEQPDEVQFYEPEILQHEEEFRFMEGDLLDEAAEWLAQQYEIDEETEKQESEEYVPMDVEIMITEGISEWLGKVFRRNPCLAHLLQLAIKDTLRKCHFVEEIVKRVQKIINFFSKSPKFTEMLRERTKGYALLKIGITRWNSTFDALQRITSIFKKVNHKISHD